MVYCFHHFLMFHFLKVNDPREALWVVAVERDFPDAARRFDPLESTIASGVASAFRVDFQVGVMGAGPFNRTDWRKIGAAAPWSPAYAPWRRLIQRNYFRLNGIQNLLPSSPGDVPIVLPDPRHTPPRGTPTYPSTARPLPSADQAT